MAKIGAKLPEFQLIRFNFFALSFRPKNEKHPKSYPSSLLVMSQKITNMFRPGFHQPLFSSEEFYPFVAIEHNRFSDDSSAEINHKILELGSS